MNYLETMVVFPYRFYRLGIIIASTRTGKGLGFYLFSAFSYRTGQCFNTDNPMCRLPRKCYFLKITGKEYGDAN